jgi:spore coat protein A
MGITRRELLKGALVAGVGLALPLKWGVRRAFAFSQSPTISKFSVNLPGLGPTGIPLATKTQQMFGGKLTDMYNLGVAEFSQQIHGDLPNKTHFWGYHDFPSGPQRYLGGVIVATRGTPVLLTVANELPNTQLIPIDDTIMAGPGGVMVGDLPYNRIATHLHGGLTPWISDGTPFQWYDPTGLKGESFRNVPGTSPGVGTATYYWPMDQSARLVWYHDHAIGITRTNAYSGIASALIITDAFESYLLSQNLLPDLVGIPLVIQDKTFFDLAKDPNYPVRDGAPGGYALNGDLWYPWEYEADSLPNGKGRWAYGPDQTPPASGIITPLPPIAEIPEFFADTALINGAPYPTLNVTGGTFRFRMLNGSQARFWHLNLYEESSITPGEADTSKPGPAMYQIGTEGGFLPAVAIHANTTPMPKTDPDTAKPEGPFNLLLAGAERADVLIDFTGKAGTSYILYNDAPSPFPGGDPRNDYYTGDPDFTSDAANSYGLSGGAAPTAAGSGPNTRTIMKILVGSGTNGFVLSLPKLAALNAALKNNFTTGNGSVPPQQPPLLYQGADAATPGPVPYSGPVHRKLTLNEDFDDYGRLIQMEGTTVQNGLNNQGLATYSRPYLDTPTETPTAGTTEVWEIYNLTGDTHPIHFHLVNVQIIQRAKFDASVPTFAPIGGTERLPDPNEFGWKETVRMNGVDPVTNQGEVTTVIMKFDLPKVPFTVNPSISAERGINGSEYVWHCHILEHEEHDMMRPLVVSGPHPLAVVPESQSAAKKSMATFEIVNGTPPYTITVADKQDAKKFPPVPETFGSSGGTFTVDLKKGTSHNNKVIYTIKDSAGKIVTATLTITKK